MNVPIVTIINGVRATMRRRAEASGTTLLPPILVLGVFERVGSNWLMATLDPDVSVYNEPFRQQIHPSHPLSPLHVPSSATEGAGIDSAGLARHWLAAFVLSKYERQAAAIIKETNLFFAARPILELFPDAPVLIISRAAVGIVGSFQRAGLFRKWDYRQRYEALRQMARSAAWRRWLFVLPAATGELEQLTRLIFLNTALLIEATAGRPRHIASYEQAVLQPDEARRRLLTLLPLATRSAGIGQRPGASSSIYSPYQARAALTVSLTPTDAARVAETLATLMIDARDVLPADSLGLVTRLLVEPAADYQCTTGEAAKRGSHVTVRSEPSRPLPRPMFIASPGGTSPRWRNLLVSNLEFAAFLNQLRDAGVANVQAGVQLFFNETMPAGRGGKIHLNTARGRYTVTPGFEAHAAYWVTWLGAVLFARTTGTRLPTRQEALGFMLAEPVPDDANVDFRIGDTSAVVESARVALDIHHRVGNVQVWCADGPPAGETCVVVAQRYFVGAAWNTVGDAADVSRVKRRWVFGSSRGIGIRLVQAATPPLPVWSIDETVRWCKHALAALGGAVEFATTEHDFAARLHDLGH